MPWRIKNGKPVKVTPEVQPAVAPPEVTQTVHDVPAVLNEFSCPVCGRSYKTEAGRDSHVDSKHTTDPFDEEQ